MGEDAGLVPGELRAAVELSGLPDAELEYGYEGYGEE